MILITGANGFIGSSLISYLNHEGLCTIGFSRSDGKSLNSFFDSQVLIENSISSIIHLAGKAHDGNDKSNPQEYYEINTKLTIGLFDAFLESSARTFIFVSSIKALCDSSSVPLTEEMIPSPNTSYGVSKLMAEEYLLSKLIPSEKKLIILRPVMVHGSGNKANLKILHKLISKKIPWPLGAFDNKRSYCNIDNLIFIIKELIERGDIQSGVYNVADDEPLSTNELIELIAQSQNRKSNIWIIPKGLLEFLAVIGDKINLPLNTERLQKLTSSYVVSNAKIKAAIGKPLPFSTREGLLKTFRFFNS